VPKTFVSIPTNPYADLVEADSFTALENLQDVGEKVKRWLREIQIPYYRMMGDTGLAALNAVPNERLTEWTLQMIDAVRSNQPAKIPADSLVVIFFLGGAKLPEDLKS
jgi:hypothetical protein